MILSEYRSSPGAVYDVLYRLGLPACSSAFFHLAYSVRLAAEQPGRIVFPPWIYAETARHYHVHPEAVEAEIRRLSEAVFNCVPGELSKMAEAPVIGAPSPARFLAILAAQLRTDSAA